MGSQKKYWLMKSEEDVFSFDDLMKAKQKTTYWEGVRNYQARNFMRDEFAVGDEVLYYHSNSKAPGVYGIAKVVRSGYPDETAMIKNHKYSDPKAIKKGVNPWYRVDIEGLYRLDTPVTLHQMKAMDAFKEMLVVQKGQRLSIQPVSSSHFKLVIKLGMQ